MKFSPSLFVSALACVAAPSVAVAQNTRAFIDDVAQRVGLNLLTVGAAGNRGVLPSEVGRPKWDFDAIPANMGAVGYDYRINQTELTTSQLAQFANAYWQVNEAGGGRRGDPEFTSGFVFNNNPANAPNYVPLGGFEQVRINMSWYMAARYCNWLHNGAPDVTTATWQDFNTGAYDTTTFGTSVPGGPAGQFISTEQFRRSEGARFWIPSLDEWVKAAHYDPDRYGEGEGGYWMRMGGQDGSLISGPPGSGETDAGPYNGQPVEVGSYPDVRSPWGLLDTSGGSAEWAEDKPLVFRLPDGSYVGRDHYVLGSSIGDLNYAETDLIDDLRFTIPTAGSFTLRIAAAIPVPGTGVLVGAAACVALRRRR